MGITGCKITGKLPGTATDPSGNSSSCDQMITLVDTTPPEIECNAPETIRPPDAPISFTATATDNCCLESVEIIAFDCFFINGAGKRVDKTGSCEVELNGDTITILDSGGVGDIITWTVRATDCCGLESTVECQVKVVNPGQSRACHTPRSGGVASNPQTNQLPGQT